MTGKDREYIRGLVKGLIEENNVQGARELFEKLKIVYDEDIVDVIEGQIINTIENEALEKLISEHRNSGIGQGKVKGKPWKCTIMNDRLVVDFDGFEIGVIFDVSVVRNGSSKLKIEEQLYDEYSLFEQLRHEFNACPLRVHAIIKVKKEETVWFNHTISFSLSYSYMSKYDISAVIGHLMYVGIIYDRGTEAVPKVNKNGHLSYHYIDEYKRYDRRCTCGVNRTVFENRELGKDLKDNLNMILHKLFFSMYNVKYR